MDVTSDRGRGRAAAAICQREAWPNFFIVGAMKAGTTSLYEYLRRHPQVFLPGLKEPHFFSDCIPPPHIRPEVACDYHCCGNRDDYLRLYSGAQEFAAIGDASPSYLWDKDAPERIHGVCPQAKIIVLLRDPVLRAHSQYLMNRLSGAESLPFPEALRRDQARTDRRWWTARLYVDLGMYHDQIRRYIDTFGREHVLVALFDDLTRDPRELLVRVAGHIGIDAELLDDAQFAQPHNSYRMPRANKLYLFARRMISKDLRNRLLPPSMQNWLRYSPLLYGRKKPPLDPESRRILQDIYDPEVSAVENLLGRTMPELRKSWV